MEVAYLYFRRECSIGCFQVTCLHRRPRARWIDRTLADKDKRKCNVVITGLPEEISSAHDDSTVSGSTTADEIAFLKLCEENLSTKPILSHLGCRRLGKPRQDDRRPRKLLVHLTSESSVSALLSEAKKLRHSDDSVVASNVYMLQ